MMKKNIFQKMALGTALCLCAGTASVAQTYVPASENLQARKEFQDNKFGIFLHWGIYSMTARGDRYLYPSVLSDSPRVSSPDANNRNEA